MIRYSNSFGTLKRAKKQKHHDPELIGTIGIHHTTLFKLGQQLEAEKKERISCNIVGWVHSDTIQIELIPKDRPDYPRKLTEKELIEGFLLPIDKTSDEYIQWQVSCGETAERDTDDDG